MKKPQLSESGSPGLSVILSKAKNPVLGRQTLPLAQSEQGEFRNFPIPKIR